MQSDGNRRCRACDRRNVTSLTFPFAVERYRDQIAYAHGHAGCRPKPVRIRRGDGHHVSENSLAVIFANEDLSPRVPGHTIGFSHASLQLRQHHLVRAQHNGDVIGFCGSVNRVANGPKQTSRTLGLDGKDTERHTEKGEAPAAVSELAAPQFARIGVGEQIHGDL